MYAKIKASHHTVGGRLIPNELMGVPQTSFLGLRNPKNVTFSIHFFCLKKKNFGACGTESPVEFYAGKDFKGGTL